MVKFLSIALLTILTTTVSYAQLLSFGPRVGMNISKLSNIENSKAKLGLNIGAFARVNPISSLGIEVAAMFSQEGTEQTGIMIDDMKNPLSLKRNLNYLNVPIVLRYKPIGILNIFAGPQFGFLLSAEEKLTDYAKVNIKDLHKKANVSGVVGVGCDLILGFEVAVNYNFMLTKISDNITYNSGKGNTWQLTVSYAF